MTLPWVPGADEPVGDLLPAIAFLRREADLRPERGERLWMLVTQLVEQVHRLGEVPLREPVVKALLSMWEWNRPAPSPGGAPLAADRRFDAADPEAAGLGEDLRADVAQERGVAGRLDVPDDPVGDVGRHADLLLPCPELVAPSAVNLGHSSRPVSADSQA